MRGKIQAKKPRGEKDTAIPKEKERTYGIDRLNIGNPEAETENDSEWLLAQQMWCQMAKKKWKQ